MNWVKEIKAWASKLELCDQENQIKERVGRRKFLRNFKHPWTFSNEKKIKKKFFVVFRFDLEVLIREAAKKVNFFGRQSTKREVRGCLLKKKA